MTTPRPQIADPSCPYCAALRREVAKHRIKGLAERDAMESDFRARESFLEAKSDRDDSEITRLRGLVIKMGGNPNDANAPGSRLALVKGLRI